MVKEIDETFLGIAKNFPGISETFPKDELVFSEEQHGYQRISHYF